MAKVLFDMVGDEVGTMPSSLLLEISAQTLSFVAINSEGRIQKLAIYQLESANPNRFAEELDNLFADNGNIFQAAVPIRIIYSFAESTLVPEKYFQEEKGSDIAKLIHGDLSEWMVIREQVTDSAQYNIYSVPPSLHQYIKSRFDETSWIHCYSTWPVMGGQRLTNQESFVSAVFYPNGFRVMAFKNGMLQLTQQFPYEAAEDVSYHLLNIFERLKLDPAESVLLLSGMLDISSALFTEIQKYFAKVELETCEEYADLSALGTHPPHFFTHLLKLICVS